MNTIVFDPDGMRDPTPLANLPNSFANDVAHFTLVLPWLSCLYSNDAPVFGSMTELMLYVCLFSNMVKTSTASEKRDAVVGLPVDRALRLHANSCVVLVLVGYRCCARMYSPPHPKRFLPE